MTTHTAFFYGTLMAPPVLHRVIWGSSKPPTPAHSSLLKIQPAILHRHQRHKVKNADYPAILPANMTTAVRGTLVTGLTDGDIWRLDIFEGFEYKRRKVRVRVLEQQQNSQGEDEGEVGGMGHLSQPSEANVEGEEVEAETYIWVAGKHRLEPEEWDFQEFVRDKMARWVGREAAETDEGFQEVDDAVTALEKEGQDPTGGRGAYGSITRALVESGKAKEEVLNSAV
ncbi:uncharacterized protein BDR25DRAFT_308127 [Lindgomyces ingoldianus]|uniref:Uncharacterized protein n=1 Tax=Lindgomyces ingoldianus TaxID=673940 RepID=A0ACB6Q7B7_9PLEO|nr:uncharacterized protein BDR25DRAFT_308127 [Lindgomyces ingoldianus]KAF2462736.1 hypothetical protein BDR25DRAFT_308127 [Lindgomyces ingoldianus]